MDRPSRDEVLMEVARTIGMRSTCSRASVGVVVAKEGRILVTGYNGAPAGMPHCEHEELQGEELQEALAKFQIQAEITPLTTYYQTTAGKSVHLSTHPTCEISVHAEANAIAYAARYGVSLDLCDLHTTYSPCLSCAKLIINAGIREVHCLAAYHDGSGTRLLAEAGLGVFWS